MSWSCQIVGAYWMPASTTSWIAAMDLASPRVSILLPRPQHQSAKLCALPLTTADGLPHSARTARGWSKCLPDSGPVPTQRPASTSQLCPESVVLSSTATVGV